MSKQKCKKLGNHATKAERYEAHRAKMEMKQVQNDYNHKHVTSRPREHIFANQSVHSENYGEHPHEQTKRMLEKDS